MVMAGGGGAGYSPPVLGGGQGGDESKDKQALVFKQGFTRALTHRPLTLTRMSSAAPPYTQYGAGGEWGGGGRGQQWD